MTVEPVGEAPQRSYPVKPPPAPAVALVPPPPVLSVRPLPDAALDSTIALPISASMAQLRQRVQSLIPQVLIDTSGNQRIRTLVGKIKIKYRIQAWRNGPLQLSAREGALFIDVPIRFKIKATKKGLVDISQKVSGSLVVHGRIDLNIAPSWDLVPQVALSFSWQKKPCFSLFKLFKICMHKQVKPVIARYLQNTSGVIARTLRARLRVRDLVRKAWTLAHQSVRVSDAPPVHVASRPQALHVASLQTAGGNLRLDVGMRVQLRTIVGAKPTVGLRAPLPPPIRTRLPSGLRFFVPVSIEYASIARMIEQRIGNRAIPLLRIWSTLTIERVALMTDRDDLIFKLSIKVAGRRRAFGNIYLRSRMHYLPRDQQLRVTGLELDPATRQYLVDQAPWLVDTGFEAILERTLEIDMKPRLERELRYLNKKLNINERDFSARGALDALTFDTLRLGRDEALLFVKVNGHLQVQVRP